MEHFSWWYSGVFPFINFFIFLAVLIYFARKPLRKMAQQRREEYDALLSKSTATQQEAAHQLAELNRRLKGLDGELEQIRRNVRDDAQLEADKIAQKGATLAAYLHEEAKRINQAELAKARLVIQQQIIELLQDNLSKQIEQRWHEGEQLTYIHQKIGDLRKLGA